MTNNEVFHPNVTDVVLFTDPADGIAYVPDEVMFRGADATLAADLGFSGEPLNEHEEARGDRGWWRASGVDDPIAAVDMLRAEGIEAQPNHVMFVHAGCPPHPANPVGANPLGANPLGANPLGANPLGANPLGANGYRSTARPAADRELPERVLQGPNPPPTVIILDTGIAELEQRPPLLIPAMDNLVITGQAEVPDATINLLAGAVSVPDGFLDMAAGHGTFIAGIIEQLAPGCRIDVRHVVSPLGAATEADVGTELQKIVNQLESGELELPLIVNMSLGGQITDVAAHLEEKVAAAVAADIVLVASAGNIGTCVAQFPAAYPGVIAVAALGPNGPTPWTNYGDWVDACAWGADLVSTFFDNWNGDRATASSVDPDEFSGWAKWSGTSFSTPVVVAAIAREFVAGALTGPDAADRVLNAPFVPRLANLGTVVSI
jgi:hypothetical protein